MIAHADCITFLRGLADSSVDSVVTDPPAGIAFMGKEWDEDKGGRDAWVAWMQSVMAECLRVLKPGGHALVWSLPRTSHWTATALENAGFEVRDCVTHLFGTGFPKSLDVSKAIDKAAGAEREVVSTRTKNTGTHYYENGAKMGRANYGVRQGDSKIIYEDVEIPITAPSTDDAKRWQGWGTALKPAAEFWWLCRKPLSEKTVAANVLKWGTGALNIDASRVAHGGGVNLNARQNCKTEQSGNQVTLNVPGHSQPTYSPAGRFPANLILDEEAAKALDEQSGTLSKPGNKPGNITKRSIGSNVKFNSAADYVDGSKFQFGDTGGASRFFYVAKASKADKGADNTHPTVKSTALMAYLIKLVTPPGGVVLDPFMGSGSTGVAAKRDGFGFVGCESNADYLAIAQERIAAC